MLWNTTHKSCIYAMRTQKMRRRHFPLRNIFTFTHAREREPRCAHARSSALRTQRWRCHACVRMRTFCVLNDSRERWGETSYAGRKRENKRERKKQKQSVFFTSVSLPRSIGRSLLGSGCKNGGFEDRCAALISFAPGLFSSSLLSLYSRVFMSRENAMQRGKKNELVPKCVHVRLSGFRASNSRSRRLGHLFSSLGARDRAFERSVRSRSVSFRVRLFARRTAD